MPPPTEPTERDKDFLAAMLKTDKNPWPGPVMFIAFLVFVYFMTELFVR